jgi:hypothetical protein
MLAHAMGETPTMRSATLDAAPLAMAHHTAALRREGEFWTVVFDGRVCRLKDSKGLRYLDYLLRHPGSEFHVLDVVRSQGAEADEPGARVAALHGSPCAADAILDAQAKTAYRRRLEELREQLREAEEFNDLGRRQLLRAELEALTEQLAAAVGLGGRDRTAACASERARSTVTQRLKDAIRKIGAHAPVLGDYLQRAVRTGTFCGYLPGIAQVVQWNLD